jgi:hypothetical protein
LIVSHREPQVAADFHADPAVTAAAGGMKGIVEYQAAMRSAQAWLHCQQRDMRRPDGHLGHWSVRQ